MTPCPTLHDPSLAKAKGEFNMGQFLMEIPDFLGHISFEINTLLPTIQSRLSRSQRLYRPTAKSHSIAPETADDGTSIHKALAATFPRTGLCRAAHGNAEAALIRRAARCILRERIFSNAGQ